MRLSWCRVAWPVLLASAACAPSPRIVYQGNASFEYCYAADTDPKVSRQEREACWQAWLAHYTRHQDLDHVDYALRRLESLQMGDLGAFEVAPTAPTAESGGESAEASPPAAFGEGADGDPIRSRNSMKPYATEADKEAKTGCKVTCEQLVVECVHACAEGFEPCLDTCRTEERICVGGCY